MSELKESIYNKWIECYNDCYGKSSYYDTKCNLCSFTQFCRIKQEKGAEK